MVKTNPATALADYVKRRDARERELEEVRREWRRSVDEMWRIPSEELTELQHYIRGLW